MKGQELLGSGVLLALLTAAACSEGPAGKDGADGQPCTVEKDDGVVTITCADGTTATVSDGKDGLSCSVTDNDDGTKTIACADGTSAVVSNGADGQNGTSCSVTDNGDGTKTIACADGTSAVVSDGADGNDGQPGRSCVSYDNQDGTWSVICSDGSVQLLNGGSVTLEPVADGHSYPHSTESLHVHPDESRVYLRFDLSSIPEGATITHARLSMTAYDGWAFRGDGNVYARFVADDTWDETALADAEPAADEEDLGYWWLWYDEVDVIQVGTMATDALRLAVQREADGDDLLSLRLHSTGYRTAYRPREWGNADERPKLVIRYFY